MPSKSPSKEALNRNFLYILNRIDVDSGSSDHYDSCRFKSCFPHQSLENVEFSRLFLCLKSVLFDLGKRARFLAVPKGANLAI